MISRSHPHPVSPPPLTPLPKFQLAVSAPAPAHTTIGDGRRRRNAKRKTAPATTVDAVPDEVLQLVFLHLILPLDLVRAAFTCRRWCSVIGTLHSRVVCHYRIDERLHAPRRPGRNPVFVRSAASSPWTDVVAARSFALDFLPRTESGKFGWELTDVRGGLLLLVDPDHESSSPLLICNPLTQKCKKIHRPPSSPNCQVIGAFLLDGEGASGAISVSNFRVTCVFYPQVRPPNVVRACMYSFAGRGCGSWTSSEGMRWGATGSGVRFGECSDDGSRAYWTIGDAGYWTNGGDRTRLALYKETAWLSSSAITEAEYTALRDKPNATEYTYELPWPPRLPCELLFR